MAESNVNTNDYQTNNVGNQERDNNPGPISNNEFKKSNNVVAGEHIE